MGRSPDFISVYITFHLHLPTLLLYSFCACSVAMIIYCIPSRNCVSTSYLLPVYSLVDLEDFWRVMAVDRNATAFHTKAAFDVPFRAFDRDGDGVVRLLWLSYPSLITLYFINLSSFIVITT